MKPWMVLGMGPRLGWYQTRGVGDDGIDFNTPCRTLLLSSVLAMQFHQKFLFTLIAKECMFASPAEAAAVGKPPPTCVMPGGSRGLRQRHLWKRVPKYCDSAVRLRGPCMNPMFAFLLHHHHLSTRGPMPSNRFNLRFFCAGVRTVL